MFQPTSDRFAGTDSLPPRILLVDDQPASRELIPDAFETNGRVEAPIYFLASTIAASRAGSSGLDARPTPPPPLGESAAPNKLPSIKL